MYYKISGIDFEGRHRFPRMQVNSDDSKVEARLVHSETPDFQVSSFTVWLLICTARIITRAYTTVKRSVRQNNTVDNTLDTPINLFVRVFQDNSAN
jgi:hypothetical protein